MAITGTDKLFNPEPYKAAQHRVEIFEPPYLYREGERPVIASAPEDVRYGTSVSVQLEQPVAIDKIRLIKTGSSTHAFDMSQRSVALEFQQNGNDLNITLPPNGNVAPPGYYMLFVISAEGKPSVAAMVSIQ